MTLYRLTEPNVHGWVSSPMAIAGTRPATLLERIRYFVFRERLSVFEALAIAVAISWLIAFNITDGLTQVVTALVAGAGSRGVAAFGRH